MLKAHDMILSEKGQPQVQTKLHLRLNEIHSSIVLNPQFDGADWSVL